MTNVQEKEEKEAKKFIKKLIFMNKKIFTVMLLFGLSYLIFLSILLHTIINTHIQWNVSKLFDILSVSLYLLAASSLVVFSLYQIFYKDDSSEFTYASKGLDNYWKGVKRIQMFLIVQTIIWFVAFYINAKHAPLREMLESKQDYKKLHDLYVGAFKFLSIAYVSFWFFYFYLRVFLTRRILIEQNASLLGISKKEMKNKLKNQKKKNSIHDIVI